MHDIANSALDRAERVAEFLQPYLRDRVPVTRTILNAAMTEAHGGSDAEGAWSQRDSFELLEMAVVRHLGETYIGADLSSPSADSIVTPIRQQGELRHG